MALIVLDPCTLGFVPQGKGAVIQISDIEGFPEGLTFMLPLDEKTLGGLHDKIGEAIGRKASVAVATPMAAAEEVRRHGLKPPV